MDVVNNLSLWNGSNGSIRHKDVIDWLDVIFISIWEMITQVIICLHLLTIIHIVTFYVKRTQTKPQKWIKMKSVDTPITHL